MPSAIPDRYKLEVRLGRDEDVEEWLATDESLDRPVLIRSLGPETTPERRRGFVDSVSRVAPVGHPHLVKVYAVDLVPGGAYAVLEWTGGSTLADHVAAGRTVDLADFLPNATGLAGALAALHESGAGHGAIDMGAISYSVAHPSKLGGFGKTTREPGDVPALASVLETALTGTTPGGPPPSERIDGLSPVIDQILRSAQRGVMTARELEKALSAAPTPRAPAPEPRAGSRRLLYAAAALVAVAAGLVGVGFLFAGDSPGPVLPGPPTSTSTTTTVVGTTTTLGGGVVTVDEVTTLDPFGEGGENDESVSLLVDDDPATVWSTETYRDPLHLIKPGVGLSFSVSGSPQGVEVLGMTPGARFELRWGTETDIALTELVAAVDVGQTPLSITLPPRRDGHWIIWLTDLPATPEGGYRAEVAEVRFRP
ncbi:MAG: hypothetical protein L0Z47_05080 [Actinobacteria bacterium]|nr:hypothetical protein [Actinomycetota bacterium]